MKLKKIVFLIYILLFIIIYSLYVYINPGITDSRNYFYSFQSIRDNGYLKFMMDAYSSAGKLEFVFYFIYFIFSFLPILSDFFWFILANYMVLSAINVFAIYNLLKYLDCKNKIKIIYYSVSLLFLWLPSYLNMAWLWRADFSYALMLLGFTFYIEKKILFFFFYSTLSVFSHYSSLPILALIIIFYHLSKNVKTISFGIKFIILISFSIILAILYKYVKSNFTSGSGNWKSDYYLGKLIIIYLLTGLFLMSSIFHRVRKKINKKQADFICTTIFFSILTLAIAINSNGNHQDITRVMHVSVFLYCITIPILYTNSATLLSKFSLLLYSLVGCCTTIYILSNLFMLN
ncbi:hypothetical protein GKR54_05200 [Providencia alcalifaciens]|uniref:Wzy n=1 Tax=Providencia alcalifaciens TaxID=126385 RepID=F8RC09_9GAMM|nr:Wzy [Providencia alcalifaciens]MTC30472.1 hypothetical protein [Providencia alcalifaciens]